MTLSDQASLWRHPPRWPPKPSRPVIRFIMPRLLRDWPETKQEVGQLSHRGAMCREPDAPKTAAVIEPCDARVEKLLCAVRTLAMNRGIGGMILSPCSETLGSERRPVRREIGHRDSAEARVSKLLRIVVLAGDGVGADDIAQFLEIARREGCALAEILDVATATRTERAGQPGEQTRPVGDVDDGEEAHDRVEAAVGEVISQRIAADMRDAIRQPGAPRQVDADLVQRLLQLQRRNAAASRMREIARRAPYSCPDIEHAALSRQREGACRYSDRLGAVIVPLVEG